LFSSIFIKRTRLALVISILITLSGALSYFALPVSQFPNITPPTVSVSATYPGADASAVEQSIAQIIEPAINGVERMLYMRSSSGSDGSYNLTITFEVGSDSDLNAINVSNRVSRVLGRLPSEVQQLSVPVSKGSGSLLQVLALYSPDNSRSPLFLSNYATINLLDEISRVPGVASANLFGGLDYSMRIWLDVNRLAILNLTTSDVIEAINSQNSQAAVGRVGAAPLVDAVDFQLNLTANGKLSTVKDFEEIIVSADEKGGIVKVKDVARVELGAGSEDTKARFNGKSAVGIGVNLLSNANAIKTSDGVRKVIAGFEGKLPSGMKIEFMMDTSLFVKKMLDSVKETLIEAFILSAFVVFIFLGSFRSAIIPIVAVPVSLIGTFTIIYLLGYSLNTISLLALVLAIGIVVDDAIVVVENVTHYIESHSDITLYEATKLSMERITGPILAITFVLLSVFVPTIFIPGISGELYKQFAVVICSSMLISALNALTLSPALCVLLLKKNNIPTGLLHKISKIIEGSQNYYVQFISRIARRPVMCLIVVILFGICAGGLSKVVPGGFIPSEDQGAFMGELQLADAASITRTNSLLKNVEDMLLSKPWAQSVFYVSGESFIVGMQFPNKAFFVVLMKPYEDRNDPSMSVKSAVSQTSIEARKFIGAQVIPFNLPAIPGLGQSDGFQLQLETLSGASLDEFAAVARGFINTANKDPRLRSVYTSFSASTPKILLTVDRNKAKVLGIKIKDIYNTLQTNLAGTYINDFNYMGRTWQVKAEAEASARMKIDDIYQIRLRSSNNEMISLKALADVKIITGPSAITRYNNLKSITINGKASNGHSSEEAIAAIEEIAQKNLPKNFKYEWTGAALQEKSAASQKVIILTLALLFSYLFLVALYESWLMPAVVLISIIVGLFGAYFAMFKFGVMNNLYAQIGIVVLIALASKNAILIVELAMEKSKEGKSAFIAAVEASGERFRAIMMTSFAFILGVFPLVNAHGAGAETQRSVSTAVFGGMLSSSLIGIYFIPGLYILFQNIAEHLKKNVRNENQNT